MYPRYWNTKNKLLKKINELIDRTAYYSQACTAGSLGTALNRVGVMAGQLDLPSLTSLLVAGCGRMQLEAPHWATSVSLLQVVDNEHILW